MRLQFEVVRVRAWFFSTGFISKYFCLGTCTQSDQELIFVFGLV